jgi:lipid II:glycine glycyltransferase (peptidoglycan interpeptide bridge formation enzyme)
LGEKGQEQLIELCKKENALFLQVETINYNNKTPSPFKGEGWGEGYYKKFITPYTAIIDLTKSEDEILANMKPKGRYNIRLAEKK